MPPCPFVLTAITTLFAVVMTPLNLQFWGSFYGPSSALLEAVAISPFDMVKTGLLTLGGPFGAGDDGKLLETHYGTKISQSVKGNFFIIFHLFSFFSTLEQSRNIP